VRSGDRKKKRKLPILTISIMLLVGGGIGAYFYLFAASGDQDNSTTGTGGAAQAELDAQVAAEVKDLVEKVGELIVLPEGEVPTVATVSDPEKLRSQAFFENARIGHKVLIYTKARKAYLYDPKIHKLIEVAPITTQIE
jgi:hypothetical protein